MKKKKEKEKEKEKKVPIETHLEPHGTDSVNVRIAGEVTCHCGVKQISTHLIRQTQ